MIRKLAVLIAPLALVACAEQPEYPVRPGEPRAGPFELPKPAYPITAPPDDGAPPATAPPAASVPPTYARSLQAPSSQGALSQGALSQGALSQGALSQGALSQGQAASPDAPTYVRPQPIPDAPPPPDEAGPSLRGRQSPGPAMAVRSAPPPALETPREVTVRPGESLFEVAERVRTPIRAIIDLNALQPPYDVTPGEVLRIPPPVVYTVRAGDTLLSVARRFSIDPRSLANLNDIALETALRPGQRLALPALVHDSQAPGRLASAPARPAAPPPVYGARPAQSVASAAAPAAAPLPPPAEAAAPSPEAAVAAGKGRFVWPVKGDILSSFGPKGPGQRNDGVNIAAEAGVPVRAAAAGQVVYAGNTIPGFGNLVVIKHPDGWTSLYGNLGKIAVKIRAEVVQGQELGVAGLSGAVDRPQVHFEVRYAATPQDKARPVDPQTLLP